MGRGEHKQTTALIDAALKILAEQNPMTIRQLFYRLVSINAIANNLACYQKISTIMTTSRDDGRCPWSWIADRSRPFYPATGWTNAADFADFVRSWYSKNHWAMQPEYVEIWVEKDAIIGSIEEVCTELNVPIRVGRGFDSTTDVHGVGVTLGYIDKPIYAFYLGDHDPSGRDIERSFEERVRKYAGRDIDLTEKRLAIHGEDIAAFRLPPQPIKTNEKGDDSDSRSAGFRLAHGNETVELDALPVIELRKRIEVAVREHIDTSLWNESQRIEIIEKGRIADAVSQWSSMTDEDAPLWAEFQSLQQDYPRLLSAIRSVDAKRDLEQYLTERFRFESLPDDLRAVEELHTYWQNSVRSPFSTFPRPSQRLPRPRQVQPLPSWF